MEHNLRLAKDAADTAQRDLKEYKDKATRILQVITVSLGVGIRIMFVSGAEDCVCFWG